MAINTYRLWMATDANRLLANQNAFIQAAAPAFYQGNVAQLELHIVASAGVGTSPVEVPFPAGAAISVAVGDTNTYPTGGTWELMVDTTETQPMPYNATTTQVAAALNALSEVSTAGGVTVSKTGDGYTITWVTYGLKPTIGIGSDTLTPSSYESISLVQTGDANTRQIVFVELRQNPIALGVDWTALPSPSVTVSEVQAWNGTNRIWRVSIDPQPKAGTITIAYGSKTATLAYNASPSSIAAALSPAQVFATGQYQWDIAITQDSVLTAFGSLVGYYGFTGSINFATAECHQFLAGAERKATMLEVSISVDSKRYTLIQTVCNVFADVVSDGVLVPLPLGTAMSEQVANARFVRRDINQYPDGGTQNEIWRNIGLVSKDGTDVVAALSYSSSPSFANPFVTLSDISGLGATWGSITGTLSDQTDLQSALDSKYDASNPSGFIPEANVDGNTFGRRNGQWETVLPTIGGALNANASITASDTSTATDSEFAGWGLGVELSADHTKGTTVEFDGLDTYDGASHMQVTPTGLTFPDSTVQTTAYTGGGGGSYLPLAGGTMTGAITFDGTSGQYISKGNFDTSRGGNYGISLVCSIGYEFNWQAGWLTTTNQNSTTPRPLYLDSLAGTTLRAWNSTNDTGTEVSFSGVLVNATDGTTTNLGVGGVDIVGPTDPLHDPAVAHLKVDGLEFRSIDDVPAAIYAATGITIADAGDNTANYSKDFLNLAGPGSYAYINSTDGIDLYNSNNGTESFYTSGGINGGDAIGHFTVQSNNIYCQNIADGGSEFSAQGGYLAIFDQTTNQTLSINAATGITFPDSTVQTTAYTGGGGGGLPVVQIAASAINPSYISAGAAFPPLTYPTHTDILNGTYVTSITYSNDAIGNHSLTLSGLTSLTTANVINNASMTSAPDFSGCTSLHEATVNSNASMTSAPSFSGLTSLYGANVNDNASMTSAPDFIGCTSLYTASVSSNASMTSAPSFSGFTSLYTAQVTTNASMTSAPDFSGCTSLYIANVNSNASMTSAPDFSGCTSLNTAYVSDNALMTSAPSFSGCTALYIANVNGNVSMTSATDFSGLTSLYIANVYNNASMTSAPSFSGCTSLYAAYVYSNASMTSAPDFSGCTSLHEANVNSNALMTSAPNFSGLTSFSSAYVSGCAITNCTDILDQLDANGLSGGYCDISGGTNQSIDPTYYSLLSLQSKGWTVIFNSL